jgi:predicted DCC family thiol-disulfide oxidoreductase YuxK
MVLSYGRIAGAINQRAKDEPVDPQLELALTSWLPVDAWREVAVVCALLMLVASLIAATLPNWRIPRLMAIASFVLLEAMKFEQQGKISHVSHPVVWAGIAFCFLPSLKNDSSERHREFLGSFFGAQVLVGLLYSCAGLSKVIGIALDWHLGVTQLNPEALPLLLSVRWRGSELVTSFASYPVGAFFLSTPWASWLSNVGILYLETATLFAVFRPRLHRPWAIALLAMHALILFTMRIPFHPSAFMVGLILLASPFAPARLELKETLLDLPIVRLVHQWIRSRRRTGADGGSQKRSRQDAPWVPSSRVMKLWIPLLVIAYLGVAFGNLDKSGKSDQEIYPISAMPMFMRINSSEFNVKNVARLRREIDATIESSAVDNARVGQNLPAMILLAGVGVLALALAGAARSSRTVSPSEALRGKRLVLFDGVCNLCNGYVSFLLPRSDDKLMFAALQSEEGTAVQSQLGSNRGNAPDSIVLVDTDGQVYVRSDAVLKVVSSLGGVYRATSVLWIVPRVLRDVVYRIVARSRYKVFGRRDLCRIPTPDERARFL